MFNSCDSRYYNEVEAFEASHPGPSPLFVDYSGATTADLSNYAVSLTASVAELTGVYGATAGIAETLVKAAHLNSRVLNAEDPEMFKEEVVDLLDSTWKNLDLPVSSRISTGIGSV
jgi:hypothetical protein